MSLSESQNNTDTPATTSQPEAPFEKKAAFLSWSVPIIAFGLFIVLGISSVSSLSAIPPTLSKILGCCGLAAFVVGFVLSLVALRGAFFRGVPGLVAPALLGFVLNGGILMMIACMYYKHITTPSKTEPVATATQNAE